MDDFFSRHDSATWPESGRLHVYLCGNDELRSVVHRLHEELRTTGIAEQHGLGLQDLEHLHFTVQMLDIYWHEVPQEQLDKLVSRLTTDLRRLDAFRLRVGPPQPSLHAVEMWVEPGIDETWLELVQTVRNGVADVLGPDVLPPLGPNGTPHISLGYGISPGDSGAITSALKAVTPRPGMVEVPVNELEFVAVTQHPDQGRFSWETVATLPVGA